MFKQLPGVKFEQIPTKDNKTRQNQSSSQQKQISENHGKSSSGRPLKLIGEKVFAQAWQKEILFEYFKKNPYPTKEENSEMEEKTGLGLDWQKSWFHYQRRKWKESKTSLNKRPLNVATDSSTSADDDPPKELKEQKKSNAYLLENSAADILEKADKFADLRVKFEELQAKYKILSDMIFEKKILKLEDLEENVEANKLNSKEAVSDSAGISDDVKIQNITATACTANEKVPEKAVKPPSVPSQAPYIPPYHHPYYPPYYPPPPPGYLPYPPYQHPPQYYPPYPPASPPSSYPK